MKKTKEGNGTDENIKIGILHSNNGYWVSNEGTENKPNFHVWIPSVTHSVVDSAYNDVTLAVERCNYLAKKTDKHHRKKTSKYKGVKWNKKERKWISQFTNEGKTESTRFDDEREAAKLYDMRRIKAGMEPVNILKKRADVVAQSGKLTDLSLEKAIKKAKPNLDKIKDVDKHLINIR